MRRRRKAKISRFCRKCKALHEEKRLMRWNHNLEKKLTQQQRETLEAQTKKERLTRLRRKLRARIWTFTAALPSHVVVPHVIGTDDAPYHPLKLSSVLLPLS